jgi:hypothetical protein
MRQTPKRQEPAPHLRIIFFTLLALAILYLVGLFTARQLPAGASFTLEPVFSPSGGYYNQDIRLVISAPNPDADVIFTVDGSVPTCTVGTIYTQPIHLSAAMPAVTVIRARVVLPDGEPGPVASASYFVGAPATLPLLSLIIAPDDLWGPERGIYVNYEERGDVWERPVDVTYVDKDRLSGFHVPAGIRIHGEGSRSAPIGTEETGETGRLCAIT